ncbi:hypothetical protein RhiirA1_443115 [Rhizophagus irregularis]|uniref:Uncharacterized protein n=1 Tax=Rhizophagus irregularis TaxID=588596 RepID=A0A2N0RKS8_9GLOM|nr:hypothetical protein RhiirA1_443115 [Rhizophagus irregularis]
MQECFYYDGFKMDIAIIDSIIQEQTNIDYNERMRENNYEVVKVHLTDVISKIGSDQILEIWRLQSPIILCINLNQEQNNDQYSVYKFDYIKQIHGAEFYNQNLREINCTRRKYGKAHGLMRKALDAAIATNSYDEFIGICHGFISDKQAILESAFFILKVPKTMLMTFQRLLPIPQSPIANEAVVHEISRQLGNWNVETGQNGIVTTSQGGYNFSVSGQKKIRAPHIAFIPENIYSSLNKTQLLTFLGQPFTPIFVAEYEKDDDDENITHQKCKWEDLDSDNILPDFTLDIEFVEKIILQKYEDDELLIEEVKENEDKGEKPMKKI